jgi:hypothetical protein
MAGRNALLKLLPTLACVWIIIANPRVHDRSITGQPAPVNTRIVLFAAGAKLLPHGFIFVLEVRIPGAHLGSDFAVHAIEIKLTPARIHDNIRKPVAVAGLYLAGGLLLPAHLSTKA